MNKVTHRSNKINIFKQGMRAGIPIGLGYLAVSFSIGIAAGRAGLTATQAMLASLLCNASAGEYAGFTVIAAGGGYISMVLMIIIANARYLLMSCAMSQRLSPKTGFFHRFLMGFYVTDEFFGIALSRKGYLEPCFTYGAVLVASPCWALGTFIGATLGNIMPTFLVNAFSVTLYGMFIAIIIPPTKGNKILAALIIICFVSSYAMSALPLTRDISEGTRIIILTLVISGAAALLFPRNEKCDEEDKADAK